MPTQNAWTLTLTPPDAPALRLSDVPQDEMYAVLRALMAGVSAADAAALVADAPRQAA